MDTNYTVSINEQQAQRAVVSSFMTKVYGWMCAGLLLTALSAWYTAGSETLIQAVFGNSWMFFGLVILELVMVFALSGAIHKMAASTAYAMFAAFSVVNGLTLAMVFLIYTESSIASTFLIAGATFGVMSLYGFVTKKDLSSWGRILFMALLGLIVASVVNIFWANSTLYWITTYVGVLIFTGLIAYDTQKLKRLALQAGDSATAAKLSIVGALSLYLDFINLFLYLLRIFGQRK